VLGAGLYIELTIHQYVEHDDENQVIFLFEAGATSIFIETDITEVSGG
jgi:hypothetical protein